MATKNSRKRKPQKRRISKKQTALEKKAKKRMVLLVVLSLFSGWIASQFRTPVFKVLVEKFTYKVNESSLPEKRVFDAINYYFDISKSQNKREKFFEWLSNPVIWYNESRRLDSRFPNGSAYDNFLYLRRPEVLDSDLIDHDYEIEFDGVYRYRRPKKKLLKFESGIVLMQNGLITSLVTSRSQNDYFLDWVNPLWRWYPILCYGVSFLLCLVILFGKEEKKILFSLIKRGLRIA